MINIVKVNIQVVSFVYPQSLNRLFTPAKLGTVKIRDEYNHNDHRNAFFEFHVTKKIIKRNPCFLLKRTVFELNRTGRLIHTTVQSCGTVLGLLSNEALLLVVGLPTGAGVVPAGAGTGAGLPSKRPMARATSARWAGLKFCTMCTIESKPISGVSCIKLRTCAKANSRFKQRMFSKRTGLRQSPCQIKEQKI